MERQFYFAADCARISGLPESTFRYWPSVGKGPRSFLLGRRRVWPIEEFHAWLVEQAEPTELTKPPEPTKRTAKERRTPTGHNRKASEPSTAA
jgi:hypothetical protein